MFERVICSPLNINTLETDRLSICDWLISTCGILTDVKFRITIWDTDRKMQLFDLKILESNVSLGLHNKHLYNRFSWKQMTP